MTAGPDHGGELSGLLRAAAGAKPDAIFARIGGGAGRAPAAMRASGLDTLADHYAARLTEADLPEGTLLLLLCPPEPRTLAAIVGAFRTGFDVALAAPSLGVAAIVAAAEACGAGVLAGPGEFADLPTGERLFEAATRLESIRLVALHGADEGAALALDAPREGDIPSTTPAREPQLLAVDFVDAAPRRQSISQDRACGIAREFLGSAGLRSGEAIVSMISLASAAGLVAGALAPMIGGAHVIWQAPFAARRFLETLETSAPAHLFVPSGVAGELGAAGILNDDRLLSLTLVAPEGAPIPAITHRVDPAHVYVMRSEAGVGLRLEAMLMPETLART